MNENERRMQVESRILGTMLRILRENGWLPDAILLDEGWEKTPTRKAVRELFDNLDEIRLRVTNGSKTHTILLIRGNGPDLISDYTYNIWDTFESTMDKVNEYVDRVYNS